MASLDSGTGVHDGVDAVIPIPKPVYLDNRANRQQIGIGCRDAVSDVDTRRGGGATAIGGCGKPQARARCRLGGGLPELHLPHGIARIKDRGFVQEGERDGRGSCCDDLASE